MKKLTAVAAALMLAGVLGACGDDNGGGAGGGGGAASEIDITASEYAFDIGDTTEVEAGVVDLSLENEGKEIHEAFVHEVPDGATVAQIVQALELVVTGRGEGVPESIQPVGGIGRVKPGESSEAQVVLDGGNFAFFCAIEQGDTGEEGDEGPEEGSAEDEALRPHFAVGMVKEFTVTGSAGDAALEGDATITASEYTFDLPTLETGEHTFVFTNTGPKEIHHAVVVRFPSSVTPEQVPAIIQAVGQAEEAGQPPPAGTPEPEDIAEAPVLIPGAQTTFEADFSEAGTYAFLCFISDRAGGPPHVAKGMFKAVSVS